MYGESSLGNGLRTQLFPAVNMASRVAPERVIHAQDFFTNKVFPFIRPFSRQFSMQINPPLIPLHSECVLAVFFM